MQYSPRQRSAWSLFCTCDFFKRSFFQLAQYTMSLFHQGNLATCLRSTDGGRVERQREASICAQASGHVLLWWRALCSRFYFLLSSSPKVTLLCDDHTFWGNKKEGYSHNFKGFFFIITAVLHNQKGWTKKVQSLIISSHNLTHCCFDSRHMKRGAGNTLDELSVNQRAKAKRARRLQPVKNP